MELPDCVGFHSNLLTMGAYIINDLQFISVL